MIVYVVGDLFQSPADVLVNTVNTVGVMGKGIAKTFKTIYPEMFTRYRRLCDTGKLTIGKVWLYKTSNKWILNFPTKTTWRNPSRIEYIEKGLEAFVNGYAERGITSIAFPALGCGNGELNWENQVRPLMEHYLKPLPIEIFIYLYKKTSTRPEHKDINAISEWLRQEPEILGFSEVWIDLKNVIGSGLDMVSFYEHKTFHVEYTVVKEDLEEKECLEITTGDEQNYIYHDELLDFWNALRSYGFGIPAVTPPSAAPYRDFLLALFLKLPYCREIIADKDYRALDLAQARSIQFTPRTIPSSSLFNSPPKQMMAI